jgi:hypothetical protein
MPSLPTTQLAELVARRRRCLTQLRDAGLRQAELIAAGDMADLLRLCAAKQQLIAALQALETQLAPFHAENPDERTWESPEARARCAADADVCRRLIGEVKAMEQDGERQITQRPDEDARRLQMAGSAGRVRQAYQNNL